MKKLLLFAIVVLLVVVGAAAAAPLLTLPGNMTVEATGPSGANVTYTATATNPAGKPLPVSCAPASGSTFPLGATSVACTATDDETPVTGTFTVTVVDTTAPVIAGTVTASAEAAGPAGSPVTFTLPTAVDAVDGPVPVTCTPTSGSTFAVGATAVACTAKDNAGQTATSSGTVVVRDTAPPSVNAPAPIIVGATSASGITSADTRVSAFLGSATATDVVTASPTITTNAPAVFPVGTTTVTFTATDSSGNASSATSTVTVTPLPPSSTGGTPTAPPTPPSATAPPAVPAAPPGAADRTPPGNVTGVKVRRGSGVVSIVWTPPRDDDFSRVRIVRTVAGSGNGAATLVYEGAGTSFRDTKLRNGTRYGYVIVSVDRNGNRSPGVAFAVQPKANLLRAPTDGASVVRPPLLVWAPVARATYYHVQLYRGTRKVLSAWSPTARMRLPASWRFGGKVEKLAPATYRWYVWPGFGARAAARYGSVLGTSTFTVAGP